MRIKNINGLSATDLHLRVSEGGRFVYFAYTLSLIVITFRDVSGVYLVRSDENTISKSLLFTVISLLFGWWGIPWGPKFTKEALRCNWKGGKDVTDEVMGVVDGYLLFKDETEEENIQFLK
jgi:hypothetical protein